nr:AAA-like domain-containing protein [Chloroflexota bacterium]
MGHFHFIGPLPADSELFVGRKKELRKVRDLCLGPLNSYVTVVGARQTGKTSFLYRLQKEIAPYLPPVLVNLRLIPDATPSGLFQFMATEIVKQLGLFSLLHIADRISSGPEFEQLLNELPAQVGRVAILLDGIGSLPEKTAIYMANVLRAVFSDRFLTGFEALGRFIFLLAGGSELLNLTMTVVSPFSNIATNVYLPDLSLGEVKQLMAYGFSGTSMKVGRIHELAEAIYGQTHGHPYLTQRMAAHLADFADMENSPPEPSWAMKACQEMLSNDENIRHLHNMLQDPALLDTAFQVVQHPTPFRRLSLRYEKLRLLGIIREQNGMALPHNALYAQAIQHLAEEAGIAQAEAPSESTAPRLRVRLLTSIIPTAFCHNLSEAEFPLVQITIDNRGKHKLAQIYARATIEGFSDEAVSSVTVPAGKCTEVALLPLLQLGPCTTLTEIRPATLRVTVYQFGSGKELLLHDQTYPVKLHAYDTALLGVHAPDGKIVDLTHHLCAFVTPHMPEIENLLRKAVEYHPNHCIAGYQGANSAAEARLIVREQVRAIYQALKKDAGLAYVNSPLNFGKQEGQITQRVRLPITSLHESQSRANCIDGTVLYASLLELASLEPVIVITPGHAFVGWHIWPGLDQYEFLETTMTGTEDFEAALQSGNQQYEEACRKGYFGRELFDPKGFARLIDVAACRAQQIYPLM